MSSSCLYILSHQDVCRRHGRALLQRDWNRAAKDAAAANIYISDTITDAEVGKHLEKFKYTERKYYL